MTTPPSGPPGPVASEPHLWDLRAAPGTLERAADSWRELQRLASTAEEDLTGTARTVLEGEAWVGDTAGSYDTHRRKVAADMRELATKAGLVARALDQAAQVLRVNQDVLDEELAGLAGIPTTREPELTFHPEDGAQLEAVRRAIRVARDIRDHVDRQLATSRPTFDAARDVLAAMAKTWQPRTVGMLNLNIGQGYQNSPRNSAGTDHGDLGDIAQIIADEDVDVVTIQEMFGQEAEHLERELEARTGDRWTVYFGEASEKVYWSDGFRPRGFHEPFGNAIAVRHGGAVEASQYVATHKLDVPGSAVEAPGGTVADGEGRSAIEVEITLSAD